MDAALIQFFDNDGRSHDSLIVPMSAMTEAEVLFLKKLNYANAYDITTDEWRIMMSIRKRAVLNFKSCAVDLGDYRIVHISQMFPDMI